MQHSQLHWIFLREKTAAFLLISSGCTLSTVPKIKSASTTTRLPAGMCCGWATPWTGPSQRRASCSCCSTCDSCATPSPAAAPPRPMPARPQMRAWPGAASPAPQTSLSASEHSPMSRALCRWDLQRRMHVVPYAQAVCGSSAVLLQLMPLCAWSMHIHCTLVLACQEPCLLLVLNIRDLTSRGDSQKAKHCNLHVHVQP